MAVAASRRPVTWLGGMVPSRDDPMCATPYPSANRSPYRSVRDDNSIATDAGWRMNGLRMPKPILTEEVASAAAAAMVKTPR